jgi:hypothetical protein
LLFVRHEIYRFAVEWDSRRGQVCPQEPGSTWGSALAWSKTEEANNNFLSNRRQADENIQEGVNTNDKGYSRRRLT